MSQEYYFRSGHRICGPYTAARLLSMARNGEFSSVCEVSTDQHSWRPATEFPELFPKPDGPRFARSGRPAFHPPLRNPVDEPEDIALELQSIAPAIPVPLHRLPDAQSTKEKWFYTRQGYEVTAPVDWESLQRMVSTGEISANDQVWTEDYREWTPVTKVPGLSPIAPPPSGAEGMAVTAAIIGVIALLLFTSFMVPIALRLRNGQFDPASNPLLIIGSMSALLLAVLSIVLGHLRLAAAKTVQLHSTPRSAVIVALIGGYTVVVMEAILTVVAVVYLSRNT